MLDKYYVEKSDFFLYMRYLLKKFQVYSKRTQGQKNDGIK